MHCSNVVTVNQCICATGQESDFSPKPDYMIFLLIYNPYV